MIDPKDPKDSREPRDKDDGAKSMAGDLIKKVLTAGVGAIFLTEEGLRNLVSEIKLPKELLGGVLDSAQKTKREFLQGLSNEVLSKVMERTDPKALIEEFVRNNEIELTVKVKFNPKK